MLCSQEVDFVKELGLKQKNCTADIKKSTEEMYKKNEPELKALLEEATPDDVKDIFEKMDTLNNNFEGSFIEYLSNPVVYENKVANLNQELSVLIGELTDAFYGPLVDPQKELDEILDYMSDKNLDFILVSRPFDLNNEILIMSDKEIVLGKNIEKYDKGSLILLHETNYVLKNNMDFSRHLQFIVRKEDGNFSITIDRA